MILQSNHNKRIAKNTLLLYFRMFFIMAVSLYTSRVVLRMLGVEDYGVYNVVGGIVSLLGLLTSSLSTASLRFFTYELGRDIPFAMKRIFSLSLTIHIVLAFLVLFVAELLGVWFLNSYLNIPSDRLFAANVVYQCSIISFFVTLISIPYNTLMVSHERMSAFAYIGVLDVFVKVILILWLAGCSYLTDKLIGYAIVLLFVTMFTQLIHVFYCRRNFPESYYCFVWDRERIREMTGFLGWSFMGSGAGVLRDHGVNLLLNVFCGPVVNAARGISYSLSNAVNGFVRNFMVAVNPQITKSYAAGEREYTESLVHRGSRFTFYILLILAFPILFETDYILRLWLNNYPIQAVIFVRLLLILNMIDVLSNTLNTLQLATGRIRNYQLIVGLTGMLNLPFSYLILWLGGAPEITILVAIFLSIVCLLLRLFLLQNITGLSVYCYLTKVVGNTLLVAVCTLPAPIMVYMAVAPGGFRFIFLSIVSSLWTFCVVYAIGCSQSERVFIRTQSVAIYKKIFNRV